MITTTLNRIKKHRPCNSGWKTLLTHLNKIQVDDEPLPFSVIVESNGLEDALWCCRAEPEHDRDWRLFAVWCARSVQHLMTDERSINSVNVAEKFAHGEASREELAAALDAASAAITAAWAASEAASAAWAASAEASAASAAWAASAEASEAWAAWAASAEASEASAASAAWAAWAASAAASAEASEAARAASAASAASAEASEAASAEAREGQKEQFLKIVGVW